MLMSIVVFAGASMVASAQLLASNAPALLIVFTTLTSPTRRSGSALPSATSLTAIWATEVLVQSEQLPAGAVAIAVAWRWRMTFATIIAGLLALHFFAWVT